LTELLKKELILGYVYGLNGERQEYYFAKSPSCITSFIMLKKEHVDKMILTDTLDRQRAWIYCRIDAPEDTHVSLKGQKKELIGIIQNNKSNH